MDEELIRIVTPYHLRLMLASIIGEGEEKRSLKENVLQLNVSVVKAQLKEMLTKPTKVPLLDFYRSANENQFPDRPELQVTYQRLEKVRTISGVEFFSAPATTVNVRMAPAMSEVDISIYDRLRVISETYPFEEALKLSKPQNTKSQTPSGHVNFKIDSTALDVSLRFPVTDLRPIHDSQRVPWWERNVRNDYLMLKLVDSRFMNVGTNEYSLESAEILLFYFENDTAIPLGQCKGRFDSIAQMTTSPTVLLSFGNKSNSNRNLRMNEEADRKVPPPTPFSSKRVCRESDTPHKKQTTTDDTEILVIPGDKRELANFCDFAFRNSIFKIKIDIPVANLQLRSKHLYEVLYNRVNSDLLLWQPASHQMIVTPAVNDLFLNVGLMEESMYVPSAMADMRNLGSNTSSSSSDSSSKEDDDYFYSLHGNKNKKTKRQTVNHEKLTNECDFAFWIGVDEVNATLYLPVRNGQNLVIPEQFGELVIKATDLKLFSVRGFCGNDNLGYLCLDASQLEAFHCGLIPSSEFLTNASGERLPEFLLKTIYPTEKNVSLVPLIKNDLRKMLSMAIQIRVCPEQQIKRIRLAIGIQSATLKHNPTLSEHSWLMEIMDMFDVIDYPVPGYTASGVITEMHLHLWDCTVDYRPLFFPYRAVGTIGNFMISTNITSPSMGCTLRFVAEDSTLCLAPQEVSDVVPDEEHVRELILHNDNRDLVCVVELGLFEISLRLNDKATSFSPKFDLRAAVNDVHIRTCADSARALAQFISYVASEGDLHGGEVDKPDNEFPSEDEMDLLSVKKDVPVPIPEVTKSQQKRVTNLMEEAMLESRRDSLGKGKVSNRWKTVNF